jgi:FkbM family methyltransferase
MLYNRNDQVIGRALELYGEYCEGEIELLRQLCGPGSIVADVGANIGAVTVPLALHVGERGYVFAFEPQRVVFQTLCANVALQSITNVECVPAALGEREATLHVPDIRYDLEANFGGVELGAFASGRPVAQVTLDAYAHRGPFALVKIDVEGMEIDVLRGGRALIESQRPLLYVENDRADKSSALVGELRALRYRLFWHRPLLFNPNNARGNDANVFAADSAFSNMLCIPQERDASIDGLIEVA